MIATKSSRANLLISGIFLFMTVILSLAFVPDFLDQAAYRFLIGAVALLISCGICIRTAVRFIGNRANTFDMGLLGYAVFGFLDIFKFEVLEEGTRPLSPDTELIVVMLLTLSLVAYVLIYRFAKIKESADKIEHLHPQFAVRFFSILVPLVLILTSLFLYFKELQTNAYFALIGYFLKAFVLLSFFIYCKSKRKVYLLISLATFALVMTDSSRRAFIVVLLPAIILFIDTVYSRLKKLTPKKKIIAASMLIVLFIFLNWMRGEHNYGEGYIEGDRLANTLQYIKTLKSLDTFYNTGFIVENFPGEFHYYYGETYASVLVGLVPRSIWPSKPVSLGAPLGLMQVTGSQEFNPETWGRINRYSLSPGFIGEAYANFGVLGVIMLSLLLGWAAKFIDHKIFHDRSQGFDLRQLIYLPIMITFLLMGRGDFYSAAIYTFFMTIFLKVMTNFLRAV